MSQPLLAASTRESSRSALTAWCFYDWANSAFAAIIITFVFPTYFSQMVAGPGSKGAEDWGFALGLSEGAVAILAPLFGAVADRSGGLSRGSASRR